MEKKKKRIALDELREFHVLLESRDLDFEILDNAFSADTKRKGLDFDFETAL